MHSFIACAKENNAYTSENEKHSPSSRQLERYSYNTNSGKDATERPSSPIVTKDWFGKTGVMSSESRH